MKSKITKRLIITNLLILVVALFCFYLVSVYNLNSQALEQAEQQIFAESSTVIERTINTQNMLNNVDIPNAPNIGNFNNQARGHQPFNNQQDAFVFPSQDEKVSIHIYCEYDALSGELIFPEETPLFRNRLNLNQEAKAEIANMEAAQPEIVSITNENYLVLLTPYASDTGQKAVLSLLAMESVNTLTSANIISFSLVFALLIAASFIIIYRQSVKITAPLKLLTKRAEKYANNDFGESFAVNTGDEIESLSLSIQTMVENIIAHEKSQTALFRNLSHELKTPLTAISGYAENIQNNYYQDQTAPLNIIQEECSRMRDILDNLIFLSKMNSNVESFAFAQSDIVDIVTMSIEKVESIAILNDIDIIYNPPAAIIINADQAKLLRALINLLSNALKHTKDYVEVQIQQSADFVTIIISDNGAGFAQNKMDKLFLTTTGETVDGNGIGLLIVYEIIKKHGGLIEVRNKPTGGAEVVLSLPK